MRIFALTVLLCVFGGVQAQKSNYAEHYSKAIAAYKAKSYPEFYKEIKEANSLHPYHQGILYQLGIAAALTNHKAEAIENLKRAIMIDNRFRIDGLADFNSLTDDKNYKALLAFQKEFAVPLIHSDTAVVIHDRRLHVEGIAYDPATSAFYAGSIHKRKIIKVKNGVVSDFCPSEIEGMTSIFGLKIDHVKKVLWACSSPMKEMEHYDSTKRSAIYKFDLATGKLLARIGRPDFERDGVFGDLLLSKKGEVFVSDSQSNTIFTVNEETSQLVPWFTSDELWNLQGMTFSENEKLLFISDYIKGIFKIDTKTKEMTPVSCSLPVSLKGTDGLYFYKNSLLAIQNGVYPLRATRYFLNDAGNELTRYEIIDRGHPAFDEPTLGTIENDTFYYIADSQWNGYDAQQHILPDAKLHDIIVLRYSLK